MLLFWMEFWVGCVVLFYLVVGVFVYGMGVVREIIIVGFFFIYMDMMVFVFK